MHEQQATECIGSMVIASDEFWGTYTGILEGVIYTRVGTIAKVKIIENIVKPCQHAVFYPQHRYDRIPYVKDSIKSFKLENIKRDEPYISNDEDDSIGPGLRKLLGQAVVRLINGDRKAAAELSKQAHLMWFRQNHLFATVNEIINYKGGCQYESK